MKKILILSTITAATLFATNGDNLIGLGAESRALGGTGIAMYQGSENAMTNPALLGKTKGNKKEITIAGTFFKADVSASTTVSGDNPATPLIYDPFAGVERKSDVGMSVIPYISHAHRLSNSITMGFGIYGTAGMGVDYVKNDTPNTGDPKLFNMKSELQIMQIAPSIAYNKDNYGVGLTAIIQYGKLSIDYDTHDGAGTLVKTDDDKMSSDTGFGFTIGGFYDIQNNVTIAAIYKSAIDMEYGNEISNAASYFGYGKGTTALAAKPDHLEQPAEIGLGFAITHKTMTYTADFKTIKWGDAKGYKDFGWEDQNVIALGAKYSASNYWIGLGFNKSNNPIKNNKDKTYVRDSSRNATPGTQENTNGDTMNVFNYVMFPGTITKAYTFGGGYDLNKDSSIELAYTIMPEVSDTVSGATVGVGDLTTKHSQTATTIAYKFTF